jgi:hypothetical protein
MDALGGQTSRSVRSHVTLSDKDRKCSLSDKDRKCSLSDKDRKCSLSDKDRFGTGQ